MERHRPTEADGKQALLDHLLEKAAIARTRYGPLIDADAIMRLLSDKELVRYPTGVRFDATGLNAGEFAFAMQLGEHPKNGYCILIHPSLEPRRDLWASVIAYQIPPINYGEVAAPEDCEQFGAALLGIDVDTYYDLLCEIADSMPGAEGAG